MIESEVTLLPQPDSPTTASVSPGDTEKETPSTARTTPSRVKKWVLRPSISSRGAAPAIVAYMLRARRGSSASRNPSPSMFTDSTAIERKRPGKKIR